MTGGATRYRVYLPDFTEVEVHVVTNGPAGRMSHVTLRGETYPIHWAPDAAVTMTQDEVAALQLQGVEVLVREPVPG